MANSMANMVVSDEFEWINRRLALPNPINREDVECILNFSFIWNLFEGQMCNTEARINKLEEIVHRLDQKGKLLLDDFKPQLLYFRNRYVTNGLTNSKFMGLKFRRNDSEELVKNVLEGNDNELPNVVLALLVIVFRLRNNMFHGIKALPTIGGQVGNFKHANKLLMKLIEME